MLNRRRLFVATVAIAVVVGWVSCHVRSDRIEAGFDAVSNGDSEQRVRANSITKRSRVSK
jgi:hypothetical protein